MKSFIIEKLRHEQWSPEQIAGELKKRHRKTVISHETIYQFVYSEEGKMLKLWTHLRHKKMPKRQGFGERCQRKKITIPDRVSIHERCNEAKAIL